MKWKCINDWFGYCSGEPDGAANARMEERATKVNGMDTIVKINIGMGATCSLDKKTCGEYQTFEKAVPSSPSEWVEPEVLAVAKAVVVEQAAAPKPVSRKSKAKQDTGVREEIIW